MSVFVPTRFLLPLSHSFRLCMISHNWLVRFLSAGIVSVKAVASCRMAALTDTYDGRFVLIKPVMTSFVHCTFHVV